MRVLILVTCGLAITALLLWIRAAPLSAQAWHRDPVAAPPLSRPNGFRMTTGGDVPAIVFAQAPLVVARAFLEVAIAAPRTRLIAGDAEGGWFTLVQRSRLMGYPDVISVRVVPAPEGAALHVVSRARFGYSDLGVNSARIRDWTAQVRQKIEGG